MSVDAKHVLVAGPSGGGKSTYLRELHARHEGPSVFMTTKRGERKAQHNPPKRVRKSSARYPADIEKSRQWARNRSETTQVIVDEAQNAPTFAEGEDGPVRGMMHEDRSEGVKAVVATQNPQDLHQGSDYKYGAVQQAEYWVFVGKAKTWHIPFFRANGMAGFEDHLPTNNYEYIVIDPAASLSGKERIVYRGQTDRRFG